MSLLSYVELCELVEQGVIEGVNPEHINAASIDVTLGDELVIEEGAEFPRTIDIHKREIFPSRKINIADGGYVMAPDEFVLASTREVFNLPNNICAEFKLKSSGARTGLENALATWCDPKWTGSVLTLELKNFLRYNNLKLTAGMRIGQMVFRRVVPVPDDQGYDVKGRYNNDKSTQVVKL